MVALVGYTGFVGSNLYSRARNRIKGVYNSQNIEKAYGLEPEVLIYEGLRAEKYLANSAIWNRFLRRRKTSRQSIRRGLC